jgi:hypothetical protein
VQQIAVTSEGSQDEEETQCYLTAMDINSREVQVSLDLHDAKLLSFLSSLQLALQMATRIATRIATKTKPALRARLPMISGDRQRYRDQRLSIQGENLTVEELLDKVCQTTGCNVSQDAAGGLVIASGA